jgi:hypothetical protein
MKLIINLVTRGRPEVLARTIESTIANITLPETVLMVSVDEDDEATRAKLKWFAAPHVLVSVYPREDTLGEKYNRALVHPCDLICNLSDYTAFAAKGFDEQICQAAQTFPDGYGFVVNHLRNASFPDIFAMTRKLADKLTYYFPPLFPYWFSDHWVYDIAKLIDREHVIDCPVAYDKQGKPPTQNIRELAWWATFFDAGYLHRRMAAHAIVDGEDFEEAPWRKTVIKSKYPHIEWRSRWINEQCRAQARDMEWNSSNGGTIPPDERYIRAKIKAMNLVPGLIAGMPPEEQQRWVGQLLPPANVINIPRVGMR